MFFFRNQYVAMAVARDEWVPFVFSELISSNYFHRPRTISAESIFFPRKIDTKYNVARHRCSAKM